MHKVQDKIEKKPIKEFEYLVDENGIQMSDEAKIAKIARLENEVLQKNIEIAELKAVIERLTGKNDDDQADDRGAPKSKRGRKTAKKSGKHR